MKNIYIGTWNFKLLFIYLFLIFVSDLRGVNSCLTVVIEVEGIWSCSSTWIIPEPSVEVKFEFGILGTVDTGEVSGIH